MKGKHVRVPLSSLRRYSLRRHPGGEEELKALARSWLARAIHPIVCRPDMTLVDGHRRTEGLGLLGETEVDVFVTEDDLTDGELLEAGLVTAFHRRGLSGYEQWQAVLGLHTSDSSLLLKDIAGRLQIDPSGVTHILSPSRCCRAAQEALKAGRITLSDCNELAKLAEDDQLVALQTRLNGGTLKELKRAGRGRGGGQAVKAAKIRCPLPSGQVITVSGAEVSLEEAIELLNEAMKAMREAVKKGITAKSFQSAMKDIARAS
ncbi:ParB/RepB/Spo0J family partition protein [Singulisphaera sp. PoT]|uniref:ParB/RepB/Spo0J family partition protein n=1 Tax=Singulisphaera sp. PoT TaxID=3411797 RepID=UPI003BF61441